MTSHKEYLDGKTYIHHYSSERFGVQDSEMGMGIEFYEDDDPRVIQLEDRWGDKHWVVGRSVEGQIKWVWTVNERGEFGGLAPGAFK